MMDKISRPDPQEFEEQTFCYMKQLFRLAFARVGNADDAEDIVQDTYMKAFRSFDSFKGKAQLKTWLTRILINAANDHIRRSTRSVEIADHDPFDLPDELASDGPGPEEILCRQEIDSELRKALIEIPEIFLVPLILREIHEASYEEIAQTLDLPKGTVMSRLSRARALLKKNLGLVNLTESGV